MDRSSFEHSQILEEMLFNAEDEEEDQAIAYQFLNNTRFFMPLKTVVDARVIQHVASSTSQTMQLADSFARRYMLDLKEDMSTSSLTGDA